MLAFTRYCFTLKLYRESQSSFHCPPPPAKPTLLQYYCTTNAQYTLPHRPPPFNAMRHTILVMAISCKGQVTGVPVNKLSRRVSGSKRKSCKPINRSHAHRTHRQRKHPGHRQTSHTNTERERETAQRRLIVEVVIADLKVGVVVHFAAERRLDGKVAMNPPSEKQL